MEKYIVRQSRWNMSFDRELMKSETNFLQEFLFLFNI